MKQSTSHPSHPSHSLVVIGVTGTNGKTTVTHLIGTALKAAGYNPFVLGTLNSGSKELSTPVAKDIYEKMESHLAQGGTHFVMEVTSEGIDQGRVVDVDFDVKVLTNITQDHLDYHKSFSAYKKVKLGFMADGTAHKIYPQDFSPVALNFTPSLVGDFNLLNLKAAITVLNYLGVPKPITHHALSSCPAPNGRMECVAVSGQMRVFIDYAHTPDALANVLDAAKKMATAQQGRALLLFGCGGNRDSAKRAKMGRIGAQSADYVVLTDDNPRDEDSLKIIDDIESGIPSSYQQYTVIPNRSEAIKAIIAMANDRDIVILAGKGHENYQIVAAKTLYFNERAEVTRAMELKQAEPCLDLLTAV